jgi:hypothetical protein
MLQSGLSRDLFEAWCEDEVNTIIICDFAVQVRRFFFWGGGNLEARGLWGWSAGCAGSGAARAARARRRRAALLLCSASRPTDEPALPALPFPQGTLAREILSNPTTVLTKAGVKVLGGWGWE